MQSALLDSLILSLTSMLAYTDSLPADASLHTPFHSPSPPPITIEHYVRRLARYSDCSPSIYIVVLVYLDRLQLAQPRLVVSSRCVYRLLVAALVLAVKANDDVYYKMSFYAQVGGVPRAELAVLERELAQLLAYDLTVTEEEYSRVVRHLLN
jgi:hypothetical protein